MRESLNKSAVSVPVINLGAIYYCSLSTKNQLRVPCLNVDFLDISQLPEPSVIFGLPVCLPSSIYNLTDLSHTLSPVLEK